MLPLAVVEHLDVIDHIIPRFLACCIVTMGSPLATVVLGNIALAEAVHRAVERAARQRHASTRDEGIP